MTDAWSRRPFVAVIGVCANAGLSIAVVVFIVSQALRISGSSASFWEVNGLELLTTLGPGPSLCAVGLPGLLLIDVLGTGLLLAWPRSRGRAWLLPCAATLASALLSLYGILTAEIVVLTS